jgi:hypothetical protein
MTENEHQSTLRACQGIEMDVGRKPFLLVTGSNNTMMGCLTSLRRVQELNT